MDKINEYVQCNPYLSECGQPDIDLYLAALNYPNHLTVCLDNQSSMRTGIPTSAQAEKVIDSIHDPLYQFSLTKLYKMIRNPQIQFLYSYYHTVEVLEGDRIGTHAKMKKNPVLYEVAF